jgi:hypothetical protein
MLVPSLINFLISSQPIKDFIFPLSFNNGAGDMLSSPVVLWAAANKNFFIFKKYRNEYIKIKIYLMI